MVDSDSKTGANYQKSFLPHIDYTLALEGSDGIFNGEIKGLANVVTGMCK
jgi:hypothetical protein